LVKKAVFGPFWSKIHPKKLKNCHFFCFFNRNTVVVVVVVVVVILIVVVIGVVVVLVVVAGVFVQNAHFFKGAGKSDGLCQTTKQAGSN
jgi:5-bromo-4-chloroindolyl phosphate hydrolysis protein